MQYLLTKQMLAFGFAEQSCGVLFWDNTPLGPRKQNYNAVLALEALRKYSLYQGRAYFCGNGGVSYSWTRKGFSGKHTIPPLHPLPILPQKARYPWGRGPIFAPPSILAPPNIPCYVPPL